LNRLPWWGDLDGVDGQRRSRTQGFDGGDESRRVPVPGQQDPPPVVFGQQRDRGAVRLRRVLLEDGTGKHLDVGRVGDAEALQSARQRLELLGPRLIGVEPGGSDGLCPHGFERLKRRLSRRQHRQVQVPGEGLRHRDTVRSDRHRRPREVAVPREPAPKDHVRQLLALHRPERFERAKVRLSG
jgi:hypothetical protein